MASFKYLFTGLLLFCNVAFAADVPVIQFSNRIVCITNLQGRAYANIKLVRADKSGIIYSFPDGLGGGLIHYTNLSADTLESMGLNAGAADDEKKSVEKAIAMQKQAFEAEKEEMRKSENYVYIHLTGYSTYGVNSGIGTIAEYPHASFFLIYNVPSKAIEYLKHLYSLRETVNQVNGQIEQNRNRQAEAIQQLQNLYNQQANLKNERARGENLQWNNLDNANYNWNAEMDQRQANNEADISAAKYHQSDLRREASQLAASLKSAQNAVAIFSETPASEASHIKAFVSKVSKYQGNPIIFSADDDILARAKLEVQQ